MNRIDRLIEWFRGYTNDPWFWMLWLVFSIIFLGLIGILGGARFASIALA
jgi:hypothetical protein